jgi:hypothetical protein
VAALKSYAVRLHLIIKNKYKLNNEIKLKKI